MPMTSRTSKGGKRNISKSLSHGRPASLTARPTTTLSARKTRTLIRNHHSLSKTHAAALRDNDKAKADEIEAEIEAQGGLTSYQAASKIGQSSQRGGDSSKVLVEWLAQGLSDHIKGERSLGHENIIKFFGQKPRMLEVGALSTSNSCSRSGLFDMTRIDLHSQDEGILQQDFMKRPIPELDSEKFDCVSLSLVLNYVPDPKARGDMLRHTLNFLSHGLTRVQDPNNFPPSIFIVLPAPCVTHSRYLDEKRLREIMSSLGLKLANRKSSAKLVYYLFIRTNSQPTQNHAPKVQVNPGKTRNNFAIVLD